MSRRLVRTSDLAGFRRALARLAREGTPLEARRRAIIVPTRASAELLRQTLERAAWRDGTPLVLPDLLTRDEWIARLHLALPGAPRMLARVEREVLMAAAADRTGQRARMGGAPFTLRPALVATMLDFYDELRRRQRSITRFRRALFDELKVERGTDRGSESLIHQTAFLGLSFLAYERAVRTTGRLDEHLLRERVLQTPPGWSVDHLIVAVADHPTDPRGLWPADFDLLGRWPGLRVDVVMTDEAHDAGFRERLERELPGIEEAREPGAPWTPVIVRPPGDPEAAWCQVSRDRDEEVRDVIRHIRARASRETRAGRLAPTAMVFQRPLPYLYLARQSFEDAGVETQVLDALPLAAAPYAALLDLVLVVARTGGTRESMVALLRSPLLRFDVDGRRLSTRDVAALDDVLLVHRVAGSAGQYPEDVERALRASSRMAEVDGARRAARVAAGVAEALAPFQQAHAASAQVAAVADFLRAREAGPRHDDRWRDDWQRARAGVLGTLDALAGAYRRHDDHRRDADVLVAAIRHQVERHTFSPGRHRAGVHLVDAVAARFGEFDHVHLVGLVDAEWPDRQRRSVFYTSGLLAALGWPQDADHAAAQLAGFRDLAGLPSRTLTLHAFQFEGDAAVGLSPLIETVRGLPSRQDDPAARTAIFSDELTFDLAARESRLTRAHRDWLDARRQRPPLAGPAYRGLGLPQAPRAYRVSKVDRYVTCPFQYFAESVLGLASERDEASGLTPMERGTLMHSLFEQFYRAWTESGRGTITAASLPDAVSMFSELVREACASLPAADRVLEETRLLGSLVARGLGERVFELEAEDGGEIVDRHVEEVLRGPFTFPVLGGLATVTIEISGKADRIDVFRGGGLRVVDYKLGRMPDLQASVQVAVYAHAAQQHLRARDGGDHPITAAMYLAFGDEYRLDGRLGQRGQAQVAVETRAGEFAGVVARIENGEFPARPVSTSECGWCAYAGVCRKEYALEDDVEPSA